MKVRILIISITFLLIRIDVYSQENINQVDMSFNIRQWDPVHIKAEEKNRNSNTATISFIVRNSTYYPFMVIVDFTQFDNLSPRPPEREIKVTHGTNNLFTLGPQIPNQSYGYAFTFRYWLRPSDNNLNKEYPYIMPFKEGRQVVSRKTSYGVLNDSFTGNKGDTIYCMRRGLVTAVPRTETLDFRISDHDCVEVLHEDGTYMIYHYLSKFNDLVAPGKTVLPGQALGTLSDSSYVLVTLRKIDPGNNLISNQEIRYTIGTPDPVSYSNIDDSCKSIWPKEVLFRELQKKEIKKITKEKP
jgi:hypothetical protein